MRSFSTASQPLSCAVLLDCLSTSRLPFNFSKVSQLLNCSACLATAGQTRLSRRKQATLCMSNHDGTDPKLLAKPCNSVHVKSRRSRPGSAGENMQIPASRVTAEDTYFYKGNQAGFCKSNHNGTDPILPCSADCITISPPPPPPVVFASNLRPLVTAIRQYVPRHRSKTICPSSPQ